MEEPARPASCHWLCADKMAIRFPDLAKTNCCFFRTCGRVKSTASPGAFDVLKEMHSDGWVRASTRVGSTSLMVVAGFGGSREEPSDHVHVDVLRRGVLGADLPGKSVSISSIRDTLTRLDGEPMGVNLRGRFTIVKTEPWPSIVRASRF